MDFFSREQIEFDLVSLFGIIARSYCGGYRLRYRDEVHAKRIVAMKYETKTYSQLCEFRQTPSNEVVRFSFFPSYSFEIPLFLQRR